MQEHPSRRDRAIGEAWARPVDDVLQALGVSRAEGLTRTEVHSRRKRFGPNRLRQRGRRNTWRILAAQFGSVMMGLLLVAAALSVLLLGDWIDGAAIALVIVLNVAIGFVTELRAVRSMEALHRLTQVTARVRRDGAVRRVAAADLVPGDVVIVEGGDVVTADLRLLEAANLLADESALTGESVPVAKGVDPVAADAPLAERSSILFKGTAVTCGSGEGAVVATGLATELGDISQLVEQTSDQATPLERRLERLGRRLIGATVKGAPEAVLAVCTLVRHGGGAVALTDADREAWRARNDQLASEGLRVLAVATRSVESAEAPPYQDLELLGLVALLDPPRRDVRDAITECRAAGIRVVMVTGDKAATARTVARAVGLADDEAQVVRGADLERPDEMAEDVRERMRCATIFARVDPAQKLDLVALHQQADTVVAMTGDGVNDAPALKKADIGVAMGRRGTQVAREAADMVLKDDAFATIVVAVREGRVIFANIRKFVVYLLSCNVSEVLVVGVATAANAPLPLLPLQILFLNLVTDVFPALALGVGPGDPAVMRHPPRRAGESIMTRSHWVAVCAYGAVITVAVLGAFVLAHRRLGLAGDRAVTVSFLTLAFAQLWHVANMRAPATSLVANDVTRNGWIWGALGLCTVLLVAAVYVPGLARVLRLTHPGGAGWALALGASLTPLLVGPLSNGAGASPDDAPGDAAVRPRRGVRGRMRGGRRSARAGIEGW